MISEKPAPAVRPSCMRAMARGSRSLGKLSEIIEKVDGPFTDSPAPRNRRAKNSCM